MTPTEELLDLLAVYVTALECGAATTPDAQERPLYAHRLAAVARMFAAIHRSDSAELKRLVDQEERAIGWGYLVGENGAAAEAAFTTFAVRARMTGATSAA